MEYDPYEKQVTHLVVEELKGCGWVQLIALPIESPEESTPDNIQKGIEAIHELFYKAAKVELSVQGVSLCIRNLDQSGRTFRVIASNGTSGGPVLPK